MIFPRVETWKDLRDMATYAKLKPGAIRMGNSGNGSHTYASVVAFFSEAGTLKIIGVLSSSREPVFPSVLTAREQGFKFQADMWRGIAVPKGTPPSVVAKLEEAIRKTVNSPEFKTQGERLGFLPAFQPSADFGKTIAIEDATLSNVMEKAGLKKQQQ